MVVTKCQRNFMFELNTEIYSANRQIYSVPAESNTKRIFRSTISQEQFIIIINLYMAIPDAISRLTNSSQDEIFDICIDSLTSGNEDSCKIT